MLSEFLGVNFRSHFGLKIYLIILFYHTALVAENFKFFINFRHERHRAFTIFRLISYLQNELLILLHVLILFRAFFKRKFQKIICDKIYANTKASNAKVNLNFILQVVVIVIIRIMKGMFSDEYWIVLNLRLMLSELVLASNDFMFVYFVSSLKENLTDLKLKLKKNTKSTRTIYNGIFMNLEKKKELQDRYSIDLFVTIFYNFLQLVIDLYYVCMRTIFQGFKNPDGKSFIFCH